MGNRIRILLIAFAAGWLMVAAACGDSAGETVEPQPSEPSAEQPEQDAATQDDQPQSYSTAAALATRSFSGDLSALGTARFPGRPTTSAVRFGSTLAAGSGRTLQHFHLQTNAFTGVTEFDSLVRFVAAGPLGIYVVTDGAVSLVRDGDVQWQRSLPAQPVGAPAVTRGGVYLVLADRSLLAVGADGAQRYLTALPFLASTPPVIAGGRVYVGGADGVVAVDAAAGDLLWEYSGQTAVSVLSVNADFVVALADSPELTLLDPETGRPMALDVDPPGDVWWVSLAGGQLLVLADLVLFSYDATTTDEVWSLRLASEPLLAPVVAGGTVIIVESNAVRTVSLSGRELDSVPLAAVAVSPPQFHDAELLLALADETVIRLDLDGDGTSLPLLDSERVWQLPPGGAFRLADRQVRLRLSSSTGGVYDIAIDAVPEQDVLLTVVDTTGESVATNMGKVDLEPTVRAALEPGKEYQLQIVRPSAAEVAELTVTTQVVE